VGGEQVVEVLQQEPRQRIDPPILELHEADAAVRERVAETLEDQVFGPLDVQLEKVHGGEALLREKSVAGGDLTVQRFASPPMGIRRERGVGAGGGVVADRELAGVVREAAAHRMDLW